MDASQLDFGERSYVLFGNHVSVHRFIVDNTLYYSLWCGYGYKNSHPICLTLRYNVKDGFLYELSDTIEMQMQNNINDFRTTDLEELVKIASKIEADNIQHGHVIDGDWISPFLHQSIADKYKNKWS